MTSPETRRRSGARIALFLFWTLPLVLALSCKTASLVSRMDKDSQTFFSQVRYIISREEQKVFLALPPADRAAFIEDFWKRRDPDPETEKNEFKEVYLARIAAANKLFRGGGKEGFIQDRGRIFILLGPPDERDTNPSGRYSAARAYETWTYLTAQIQLSFVDMSGDGEYTLVTPDTRAMQMINSAQFRLQSLEAAGAENYDFSAEVKQEDAIVLLITIPYRNFWLREREKGAPEHALIVDLTIMNPSGKEVFRHKKEYRLSSGQDVTEKTPPRDYSIRIPLDLAKGSYNAYMTLDDRLGEQPRHKTWTFVIR
jgi:GWxTD domain-containing protein